MTSPILRVAALALLTSVAACPRPPVVPTRPAELLPRVELQIDNTATQADDYVGTAATPARIRLLNPMDPPTPVPITLKNLDYQPAPQLVLAPSGTPSANTLDLTLPGDGAWVPFVVAGMGGQLSQRDKDAVIEILERRPDGIVLGRKSLMVVRRPTPIGPPPFQVEIQLGGAETIDDYVAWRPVRARVRFADPPGEGADVPVVVRNMSPVTGGSLVFGAVPTAGTTPPPMASTLDLVLPRSGEWVDFFVAGDFAAPSRDDKDAVFEVVRVAGNQLLGREGIMVRVRKNANTLTADERDRYLYAVARVNMSLGNYVVHQWIHAVSSAQAHGGPAFLAWHRPFILRYERELQAVDPAAALPYWRFDEAAPAVFSPSFMGGPPVGLNASFDPTNPLVAWTIEGLSGLPRNPTFDPTESPSDFGIRTETATLALGGVGATYAAFRTLEGNPHGSIHGLSSGGGWIGSVPTAVRDPLFFMLHANVDRLWAKWQWLYGRDDPTDLASYEPQGAYAAPCPPSMSPRLGHYVDDRMWPWDGTTGFVTAGDPCTERPATAPGGPIPAAIGGWGPPAVPRPRDVIDYDRWTLLGSSGLGYGYDDVPFSFTP